MKRILFLGHLPPPYGGIASHLRDMSDSFYSEARLFQNYDLSRYHWTKLPYHLVKILWMVWRGHVNLLSAYHAYPEGLMALLVKHLTGIPYALTTFGELHVENRWFFKPIIEGAAVRMASSEYCARGVGRFSDAPVTVTPYGIDLEHFKRTQVRWYFGPILFVGNLHKRFGIDVFIDALFALKERGSFLQFMIVGQGEDEDKTRRRIAMLGLRGAVYTDVDYDALANYYQYASILVNPANTKLPCMGLSMKEAMGCELPVIASNIGGIAEAVENMTTGLLFEPNNAEDLADKIEYLWRNPVMAENMGKAGRRRAERLFDKKQTTKRIVEIFDAL